MVLIPHEMAATEEDKADEAARSPKSMRENGTESRKWGQVSCGSKVSVHEQLSRTSAIDPVEK